MEHELGSIWSSKLTFAQKLVRMPLRLIPSKMRIRIRAGANRGLLWIVGSNVHQCWLGTYEAAKQREMNRVSREGMTVWDIGANVGFYTLAFARAVGDRGSVVAFEPLGSNVAFLLRHIELNDFRNVTVFQSAVSDRSGFISFSLGAHSSMGKIESDSTYKIPSIAIDEFIAGQSLSKPNLLKIDVEGAEALVLQGAEILLTRDGPEIWLALHGKKAMSDCTQLLKSFGYSLYRLDGSQADEIDVDEIVAKKEGSRSII
jgi:FkbM family methyltransferase